MKKSILLLISVIFTIYSFSQTEILKGTVLDSLSLLPVTCCNLSLPHDRSVVTTTNDGKFSLILTPDNIGDTFLISYPGYFPKRIPVRNFNALPGKVIYLVQNHVETNESKNVSAIPSGKSIVLNKTRASKNNIKIYYGSFLQTAILFKTDTHIKTANFTIDKIRICFTNQDFNRSVRDSMTFGLHFYSYDPESQQPGREIYHKPIIMTSMEFPLMDFNYREFDLGKYNIAITPGYFVVAIECLNLTRNKITSDTSRPHKSSLFRPGLVELKESSDIEGVWFLGYDQKWYPFEAANGFKPNRAVSVILKY